MTESIIRLEMCDFEDRHEPRSVGRVLLAIKQWVFFGGVGGGGVERMGLRLQTSEERNLLSNTVRHEPKLKYEINQIKETKLYKFQHGRHSKRKKEKNNSTAQGDFDTNFYVGKMQMTS